MCVLTSALSIVPEKLGDEFISEMADLIKNNPNTNGVDEEKNVSAGTVSVAWNFLNFVATKT